MPNKIWVTQAAGAAPPLGLSCTAVPSADINNYAFVQIGYYTSNGSGINVIIQGHNGYVCNPWGFPGAAQTYDYIYRVSAKR